MKTKWKITHKTTVLDSLSKAQFAESNDDVRLFEAILNTSNFNEMGFAYVSNAEIKRIKYYQK